MARARQLLPGEPAAQLGQVAKVELAQVRLAPEPLLALPMVPHQRWVDLGERAPKPPTALGTQPALPGQPSAQALPKVPQAMAEHAQ